MASVTERFERVVLLAVNDINKAEQKHLELAFDKYVDVLRLPLGLYRDHAAQTFPDPESLQARFTYETALLHVLTQALVHGESSALTHYMPISQSDNLFSWYSLPKDLCYEVDGIAEEVVSPEFFRTFIPDLSRHIQNITSDHDLGEFYTPAPIVEHLIDISGLEGKDIVEGKRVIDPACGSGIILIAIANLVINYYRGGGCDVDTALTALSQNLFGFDVQPFSISLAKSLLLHISFDLVKNSPKRAIPDFPNIRLVDTLTTDNEYWGETGYFHYVIGNPPFVSVKKRHITHVDRYEDILHGHPNMYQLFLWWAVKATVPNGKISFILPQSILIGTYSKQLRAKLNDVATPLAMTRMIDRYNVVAGADQQMMAVCLQVEPEVNFTDLVEVRVTRNGTDIHGTKPTLISRTRVVQNVADSTIWVVSDNKYDYTILERLASHSVMLSELSDTFLIGNGSFVWNQHKALLSADKQEHSIPLVSSASINPFAVEFPYTGNHQTHLRLFARVTPEVEQKQHSGHVLLVQRTTPRKAGRRVVAGMLPTEFHVEYPFYFIENHVNYVHLKSPKDIKLLYALNAWLNSDIINFAFQLRNGTAHISLFEMNALPVATQLLNEISDQAIEIADMSSDLRQSAVDKLNTIIFDWLELGKRHRQRIEQIMCRRERIERS